MMIFQSYTGNAMLNNTLMTIESLGNLKNEQEITPGLLLKLYNEVGLKDLNKRLKSYTMLFTKNGPLYNDKTNGDKIYDTLFKTIISNFEKEGPNICEISGLKFKTTFSQIYQLALKRIGFTEKEIQKKDTNISRTWFPLIGGLSSDAQALPQAKFTVQIHPICIAILQFLPLSAVLYKGGVFLVDSSNFQLSKRLIWLNQKELEKRINAVSISSSIENIKDFSKGNYLLQAINILMEKELFEEEYSDLNLWSFSNSGTGANCSIDHVPHNLLRKLIELDKNPQTSAELKSILNNAYQSFSFLEALEGNNEWFLLYPNVLGSGKKKVRHDGFSIEFLEKYFELIGKHSMLPYAKYIAKLTSKYSTKEYQNLLEKTDGWNEQNFRVELYKILLKATENHEWDLEYHISILDSDILPVKNYYNKYHRLVHYFSSKKIYSNAPDKRDLNGSEIFKACKWIICVLGCNERKSSYIKRLTNSQEYLSVGYNKLISDAMENLPLEAIDAVKILFNENFVLAKTGLNDLLRIYYSQLEKEEYFFENLSWKDDREKKLIKNWLHPFLSFAKDYRDYFFDKYPHSNQKFQKTINYIIDKSDHFNSLIEEAITNTNEFVSLTNKETIDKWAIDDFMNDPMGNYSPAIGKLSLLLSLKQRALNDTKII